MIKKRNFVLFGLFTALFGGGAAAASIFYDMAMANAAAASAINALFFKKHSLTVKSLHFRIMTPHAVKRATR